MAELDNLYAVQLLDSRLDQLLYQRVHLPERDALVQARAALGAVESEAARNTMQQAQLSERFTQLELRATEIGARAARLQGQLRSIVVPREAEALQREIAGLQTERGTTDDEGLSVLDTMEELSVQADAQAATRAEQESVLAAATAALQAAEADVDAQLESVRAERATAAASVPDGLLARYESLRPSFKGVAVAKLEASMCTGCHLTLSRVEFEAARAAFTSGDAVECPQCGRMLVL